MAKGEVTKRGLETTKLAPKKIPVAKRKRSNFIDGSPAPKKARTVVSQTVSPSKPARIKVEAVDVDCDICAETKPLYRNFPKVPTCSHDATVCSECYERHLVGKINDNPDIGWSICSCPLCGGSISPDDAQAILPRSVSKEINTMIKNVQAHTARNWIWCPGPNCGHGQLHMPGNKIKVACKFCGFKICYKHQSKYHDGITCEQYDQLRDKDYSAAKSLEEIQRITKACPHCKTRIKKDGGCNHMVCTGCRKQWLWDTVPFDGDSAATSAETRGGPAGAAPLQDDVRQAVEEVMVFENTGIVNPPQTLLEHPQHDRFEQVMREVIRRDNQPERVQQPAQTIRAGRTEPTNALDGLSRVLTNTWNATRDIAGRVARTLQGDRNVGVAEIFDGFAGQVRRPDLATPPVSDVRSTQARPRRRRRQPRSRRKELPPVVIDLDSGTDESNDETSTLLQVRTRGRSLRSRIGQSQEVVDLTRVGDVIDLTMED